MPRIVALLVVPRPARDALGAKLLDPIVPHAFLYADKVRVGRELQNDIGRDVLSGPPWNVVDDGRAELHRLLNVNDDALLRCLAVVRIDQQGAVHAGCEAFLRREDSLCGRVAASVANDGDSVLEAALGVSDEGEVFLPGEQVALSCSPTDDECLHAIRNLMLHVLVEGFQIDVSILRVGRLDRRHQPHCAQLCHLRPHCGAIAISGHA
mmetsp:Transcript_14510/g.31837  ORF Transcript_14510/g.31837 Transcript_14510/m.31837 type:complete len:209 (+) Transcript_14510:467-1093(+)